jgi:hypothetical protein
MKRLCSQIKKDRLSFDLLFNLIKRMNKFT